MHVNTDCVNPEHLPDFFLFCFVVFFILLLLFEGRGVCQETCQKRQADGQGSTATSYQSSAEKWRLAEDEDPIKELSVWA